MEPLPIDPYLPAITSKLRGAGALVLSAAPGAGKTTRVPRALYDAGFAQQGEIVVLEPRRLATRLAASRVAEELGEKLGETVGYSIRFDHVSGPRTRIRFLTEAILARRIIQDPSLEGVSVVILDEFHERHLATDLSLALLKQVQARKPDLRIVAMSATLDVEPILSFLPGAQLLSIPGSQFDLEIVYEEKPAERPLHDKVASAVVRLLRSGLGADILVFLPGAADIRRSAEALQPTAERLALDLIPLHGDLPPSEQARAVEPSRNIKVILATNVAETSITIPGIGAVIDSGQARTVFNSPWSGFPTLTTTKISRSSAIQRGGRAGRTQAGRVLRLYTKLDYDSRPEHETPEIRRVDMTETCLMLHGAGIQNVNSFPWFEEPPKAALDAAEGLLLKLGGIDEAGQITETGTRMLAFPVHPRLARLIVEGQKLRVAEECTLMASLLSERDIRLDTRTSFGATSGKPQTGASGPSDVLELMDRFREAENSRFHKESVLSLGLDPGTTQAVRKARQQLNRLLPGSKRTGHSTAKDTEESLLIAALAAFPDRVAKRRKQGSREFVLAAGGAAALSPASVVHNAMFIVAVDAEERRQRMQRETAGTIIRLASAIEIEWLAGLFPQAIVEQTGLIWNEHAGRVEESRRTSYGQITLEERTIPAPPSEEASRLLAAMVLANNLVDLQALAIVQARLALAAMHFPSENLPEIGGPEIREAVEHLCDGIRSLEEFARASIVDVLMRRMTERQRSILGRATPERVKLKAGRWVKIHYEPGKPPWIESRLQDFFGMSETPSICEGRVPLTLHLLAPNGRAVQVTRDLAGFWKRHYPSVRKELQRRYPRHAWPERIEGG